MRTATPRTARAINDRVVLDLLADRGALTATQLREATGLSRPSVADLLARLGESGLVTRVGTTGTERRGPNARLYGLVADRAHVAALDIRPDGVTAALADLAGRTVAEAASPADPARSPTDDPEGRAAAVLAALDRARREAGVSTVHTAVLGAPGLAAPGPASPAGLPETVPPTGSGHARLAAALRSGLGAATDLHTENEVNLAGIAEHRAGAATDRGTFAFLWLGHGVGAALVLDGALRRGASGGAGEIGFLPVPAGATPLDDPGGEEPDDLCGLLSAAAVGRLAARHGVRTAGASGGPPAPATASAPARDTGTGPDTGEEAAAAAVHAARRDPVRGPSFLDALADRVALAGVALTAVLDPGCLVLGGPVGRAGGTDLAERVARRTHRQSPFHTEVRPGAVTGNAVLTGALLTGLAHVRDVVFAGPAGPA